MRTKRRRINYPDLDLPCEICGEHFKTRQGLAGHKQFKHNSAAVIASKDHSPADPDGSSVKELKGQVERLKLEKEKRQLTAELPSISTGPDLMQQLGLGSFDPGVKAEAQRRAMALSGQEQHQTWLDRLLSSPGGIQIAADALKGVLGVNRDNGDNSLKILSDLGFDLKTLILNATAPRSGELSIGGVNLSGASLTPELLSAVLAYKASEEKAKQEYEGRKAMADPLEKLIGILTPELISRFSGGRRGNGAAGIISQKIISGSEPGEQILICPKCGHENQLPADLAPGMEIKCQGEGCDQAWHAVDDRAQPRPQRQVKKRQVKVQEPEPPPTVSCPSCGQLLDVADRGLAESVVCPACQKEYVLTSEDVAIRAEDPLTESEKQRQQFLHRG